MKTAELRRIGERIASDLRATRKRLRVEREERGRAKEEQAAWEEVRQVVVGIAQTMQQKAHQQISTIVSRCLSAVFEDPYEFRILFEQKRGKTEARMVFVRDGQEIDPMSASGGGVIDVAAFALRLACLLLTSPRPRRLLVLDEPFRFVSAKYRPKIRALLLQLSEELGVQIILVTHITELQIGTVHTIE